MKQHSVTTDVIILAALTIAGLVLRLSELGQAPLSDAEAVQSLVAWRIYQSGEMPSGLPYSPIIASLNLVMFWLFGANGFTARFGPALLGTMMIPLPYGLRRSLGKYGAVAASALLAFSPLFLFFSRNVNGEIATLFGSLSFLVGVSNLTGVAYSLQSHQWVWRGLTALGMVVMLTASPATYSLVVIGVGGLLLIVTFTDERPSLTSLARLWSTGTRSGTIQWFLALVVLLVALATAAFFNFAGLAESTDLVGQWLLGFRYPSQMGQAPTWIAHPVYPAVFSVALYEPLLLLAGLMGAAIAIVRRRSIDLLLVWWLFGSLTLDLLRPGRSDGEVLLALLPLVPLAGMALGRLGDSLRQAASWHKEGIVTLAGLVIAGYAYIQLMIFARTGGTSWLLPVAAVVLFAALTVVVWMLNDPQTALRSAAVTPVVCLVLLGISTAARLNYGTFISPRQVVSTAPADVGLAEMETTIKYVSNTRAKDSYLVSVVATRDSGPAVEWSLRNFPNVLWLDSSDQLASGYGFDDTMKATIASAEAFVMRGSPQTNDTAYVGQDFAVRATWTPAGLSQGEMIRWILLRTAGTPITRESVVLWVRQ